MEKTRYFTQGKILVLINQDFRKNARYKRWSSTQGKKMILQENQKSWESKSRDDEKLLRRFPPGKSLMISICLNDRGATTFSKIHNRGHVSPPGCFWPIAVQDSCCRCLLVIASRHQATTTTPSSLPSPRHLTKSWSWMLSCPTDQPALAHETSATVIIVSNSYDG